MTQRPWRLRALLYFYGNGNIAGCALALVGPLLLLAGVIQAGWLPITAGLYVAGVLLAGRPTPARTAIEASLTGEALVEALDRVVRQAKPHLTTEMAAHLDSLRGSIVEVLPRLAASGTDGTGGAGAPELFTVRETVLRYLPETLANYLELPPAFRATYPLKDGRTARQLLGEQLALLDAQMREVVANVAAADAQALLANGRFLEAKFRQPDFLAA